jgi:hypothetical protein
MPSDPTGREAEDRRATLAGEIAALFPGSEVHRGRDRIETVVEFPFNAGSATIRSTTVGGDDVSWTMACWPPAIALRGLADAAQDADGRLLYLTAAAAEYHAEAETEAGG